MENLQVLFDFISFLFSLGWRVIIFLFIFVLIVFFVIHLRSEKKYRKYVPSPFGLLIVMSTDRWCTKREICNLLNAKLQINLFGPLREFNTFVWSDLNVLEEDGLIERRRMYYDAQGDERPNIKDENVLSKDEYGKYIVNTPYLARNQYRKTSKGKSIKTKNFLADKDDEFYGKWVPNL